LTLTSHRPGVRRQISIAQSARQEPALGVDSMQPATHLFDPAPETGGGSGLEIDVTKFDDAGPHGTKEPAALPFDAALQTGHLVLYQTVSFGACFGQFHPATRVSLAPFCRVPPIHSSLIQLPILFVPQAGSADGARFLDQAADTFRELGVIHQMIDTRASISRTDARPLRAELINAYRSPSAARTKARNHEQAPKPKPGGIDPAHRRLASPHAVRCSCVSEQVSSISRTGEDAAAAPQTAKPRASQEWMTQSTTNSLPQLQIRFGQS